jgi:hypothetical protein
MDAAGVFISYRREDSPGHAGRLYDRLAAKYGRDTVFRDIDAIRPGANFVERIDAAIDSSSALIAVIGPEWLDAANASGGRRLDDPRDWVRVEIATALAKKALVIPVLVESATMPSEDELPDLLKPLADINALEISEHRWDYDVSMLEAALEEETELGRIVEGRERVREQAPEKAEPPSRGHIHRPEAEGSPADTPAREAERLIEQRLDATAKFLVLDSYSDVQTISKHRPLLLVMDRAEKGSGQASAMETFRSEVFPRLQPIAEPKGVIISWANVGGYLFPSDLARHLVKQGLRYMGCHLFRSGRIVATRKAGAHLASSGQIIDAGKAVLDEFERLS